MSRWQNFINFCLSAVSSGALCVAILPQNSSWQGKQCCLWVIPSIFQVDIGVLTFALSYCWLHKYQLEPGLLAVEDLLRSFWKVVSVSVWNLMSSSNLIPFWLVTPLTSLVVASSMSLVVSKVAITKWLHFLFVSLCFGKLFDEEREKLGNVCSALSLASHSQMTALMCLSIWLLPWWGWVNRVGWEACQPSWVAVHFALMLELGGRLLNGVSDWVHSLDEFLNFNVIKGCTISAEVSEHFYFGTMCEMVTLKTSNPFGVDDMDDLGLHGLNGGWWYGWSWIAWLEYNLAMFRIQW